MYRNYVRNLPAAFSHMYTANLGLYAGSGNVTTKARLKCVENTYKNISSDCWLLTQRERPTLNRNEMCKPVLIA